MSYYQATHHINPEGDVLLSDDTIYGLGIQFLHSFFGSIFLIARTPPLSASAYTKSLDSLDMAVPAADAQTLPPRYDTGDLSAAAAAELEPPVLSVASVLIGCLPDIEYFVAGGIAGIGKLSPRCCVRHTGLLCTYLQSLAPRPHHSIASRSTSLRRPASPSRLWRTPSLAMSSALP